MKKVTIILMLMIFIVIGCSNEEVIRHNYTYRGENESWSAEYKLSGTQVFNESDGITEYDSNSESKLIVTYKKDLSELASVKYMEISYESGSKTGALTMDFDKGFAPDKTYVLNSSGSGSEFLYKNLTVKVNIDIDGENQTIELNKVQ